MRVTYNRLVRDRIPEIIEADGYRPVTTVLDDHGYRAALLAKLVEEAQEAAEASADALAGELADVLEVLESLAPAIGTTWRQILALAAAKREHRGGFTRRLFLEYAERTD